MFGKQKIREVNNLDAVLDAGIHLVEGITTLMVTHNMHQALELGNRTLMMDRGHIILDVAGAERAGMTVEDLLAKFKSSAGKALDNDRILLSEQTNSDKKGASNAAD